MRCLRAPLVATVASLLLVSACTGKQSAIHYYQLAPTARPSVSDAETLPELILGVGPVTIPDMLKRQEIVIRGKGNRYRLAELHRWAGLLEKNLTTVIMENLGKQLGTDQIVIYPWKPYYDPEYRVIVDVLDLTGNPGGLVMLRAAWSIVDGSGEQLLVRTISEHQQQSNDKTFDSLVQAENQTIALLCKDISDSLKMLELQ